MTAFLDSQKKKGVDINSPEAKIDGYDPMQVFYLNYANLWAQNTREEEIRSLTSGDVHSLGENRVNVTLRNLTPSSRRSASRRVTRCIVRLRNSSLSGKSYLVKSTL